MFIFLGFRTSNFELDKSDKFRTELCFDRATCFLVYWFLRPMRLGHMRRCGLQPEMAYPISTMLEWNIFKRILLYTCFQLLIYLFCTYLNMNSCSDGGVVPLLDSLSMFANANATVKSFMSKLILHKNVCHMRSLYRFLWSLFMLW